VKPSSPSRQARAAELYDSGLSAEEVGVQLGVSSETVRRDLHAADIAVRRRGPIRRSRKIVFSSREVATRRARVAELTALGKSDYEIGRSLGVSKTTIAADRRALGIAPLPPGQPPKSPLPDPRPCETCGTVFTPRRENVKKGGGRFCSKECMARDAVRREASRVAVSERNALRAQLVADAKRVGGLITTEEVAAELGVTLGTVQHHVRQGRLVSQRIQTLGLARLLFDPRDVIALRRAWRAGDWRGVRTRWLDEEFVLSVFRARGFVQLKARRTGFSQEEVEAAFRVRIRNRAKLYRTAMGRPRRSAPSEHHLEWAAQEEIIRAELEAEFEDARERGLPGRPVTDSDVYLAIAERDFVLHRERWPNYWHAPHDEHALDRRFQKNAIAKVRSALKRLQITETETS